MRTAVQTEIQLRVEAFLYDEAALLEENRFDEWLGLMADDVRYWMPTRESVDARDTQDQRANTVPDNLPLYEDDKPSLALRVARLKTGIAHAEVPLSVTQRLITNVRVEPTEKVGEFRARSNYLVYQERRSRHGATFYGKREDVLRDLGGDLKLVSRTIIPAQGIMPMALSIFF